MSRQLQLFLSGIYSVFDVSGQRIVIKRHAKSSGTFSKNVSTDTNENLNKSSAKIGNAMRKEMAKNS
jgi:hypothetical protein